MFFRLLQNTVEHDIINARQHIGFLEDKLSFILTLGDI